MKQAIIWKNENGGVSICHPSGEVEITDLVKQVVPEGVAHEVVDAASIPSDRTFRNAWDVSGKSITTGMVKAKDIAHTARRMDRDEKMKPLDIKATIPAEAKAAEAARQVIRDENAAMQTAIDAATNEAELKAAMPV